MGKKSDFSSIKLYLKFKPAQINISLLIMDQMALCHVNGVACVVTNLNRIIT